MQGMIDKFLAYGKGWWVTQPSHMQFSYLSVYAGNVTIFVFGNWKLQITFTQKNGFVIHIEHAKFSDVHT